MDISKTNMTHQNIACSVRNFKGHMKGSLGNVCFHFSQFGFKKWKSHVTSRPLHTRSQTVQSLYADVNKISSKEGTVYKVKDHCGLRFIMIKLQYAVCPVNLNWFKV